MLHLYTAERIGTLAGRLAEVLSVPPADPFSPDWVATPSVGMRRWLHLELARHLGASGPGGDGIAANLVPAFPGTLRSAVLGADRPAGEPDPWAVERLVWVVLEVLAEARRVGDRSLPELSDGASRYAQARRIADLFDRYHVHRPAMVVAWAEGSDDLAAAHPWQPDLWRRVRDRIGHASPPERLPGLLDRLRTGDLEVDLPERLSLFGLSVLPGGAGFVDLALAVAAHRELHVFLLDPSLAATGRVRERLSRPTTGVRLRSDDQTAEAVAHPLLRSWGRMPRETAVLVADAVRQAPQGSAILHELTDQGSAARIGSPDRVGAPPSLLHRLQRHLRSDEAPSADHQLLERDRSLSFHATHGPARQVEVLRDALLHLLADDASLREDDIVVLCPALDRFSPLLEAAFGPSVGRGKAVPDGVHPPALRYRLADRSLRATNPVAAGLVALVDLADGRFDATAVLDLLAQPAVRQRYGLSDDDLVRTAEWAAETQIRWGLHPEHRERHGVPASITANTWRAGLDRLLLGVALADDEPSFTLGDVVPRGIEGDDADLAGRLADLLGRLVELTDAAGAARPVSGWIELLRELTSTVLAPADDARWQADEVGGLLDAILEEATSHGRPSPVELTFADLQRLLAERLTPGRGRPDFFRGGITITSPDSLRAIPHRVVALLGMDQAAFATAVAPVDDLIAAVPLVGDRDPRGESRQAVLDAVLAAGEHLIVVRDGHDLRTNQPIPPPVVVAELADVIDEMLVPAVDGPAGRAPSADSFEIHHPRQPFDERCFTAGAVAPGRAWSFDPGARAGAEARRHRSADPTPFLAGPLSGGDDTLIDLADLHRVLANPVQAFLQDRLQIQLPRDEDALAVRLPVELDGLDNWRVGDRLLTTMLSDGDLERWLALERSLGTLPPGILGQAKAGALLVDARTLADAAAACEVGAVAPEPLPVDVTLGDGTRIIGAVAGSLRTPWVGPARVSFAKTKPKYRLAAWLDLLALVATDPGRPWRSVAVHQAVKPRKQRGKNLARADVVDLEPAGIDANERLDVARRGLDVAVDLWRRTQREPLPLFPRVSRPLHLGARFAGEWERPNASGGDRDDRWISVVYGDLSLRDLLALPLQPHDPPDPDDALDTAGRVQRYATHLWRTVDATCIDRLGREGAEA